MSKEQVQVAIAILYQNNQFLMQLRDDIPTIPFPAHWALFGGHIEPGETPEIAVQREILEEIGYTLPQVTKFGCYPDQTVMRHVFHAPLLVEFDQLVLNEGWDMGLLTPDDIRKGKFYSANAKAEKPLGSAAQKILLEFIGNGH